MANRTSNRAIRRALAVIMQRMEVRISNRKVLAMRRFGVEFVNHSSPSAAQNRAAARRLNQMKEWELGYEEAL
jgi:hypothetical protein